MIAKAHAKYIRISPQKLREIREVVKDKKVPQAQAILKALNKKGARILEKVLNSALANAKQKGYDASQLFISKIVANQGPAFRRYKPASFGRAVPIRRRTSHILVELDTAEKIIKEVKIK